MGAIRALLLILLLLPLARAADTRTAVGPGRGIDAAARAKQLDDLIAADWAAHGVRPNPPVGDLTFLRRVTLDLAGRIPDPDEVNAFLADRSPQRRKHLIERLLASDAYVDSMFLWWADLLRIQSSLMNRPGEPYIDWVKGAIRANLPYDQMVRALLTAQGPALAEGNGATGYYLRDAGMPQDNMSMTVQVFLGTRLACAQCHNHPFDHWSRLAYWEMSAYTASTRADNDPSLVSALQKLARASEPKGPTKDEREAMRRYSNAIGGRVIDAGRDTVALPKDYQYPDARPGAPVHAHPIWGTISLSAATTPRQAYAAWLTSPDNPRFTLVIANRLWRRLMGLGLIEPPDNLLDDTAASDPALMDALVTLMKDCGYDLRRFQEVLCLTSAYQRQICATPISDPAQFHFPGPVLRRLTAEQIWDSLMCLIVPDVDQRRLTDTAAIYAFYQDMHSKTPQQLWALIQRLATLIGERRALSDQLRAREEAVTDKAALRADADYLALRKQAQALDQEMREIGFDRARAAPIVETDPRWAGLRRDFVRASELSQPAPPGHFLRDFGQSDRNLIDNGNQAPAVTQALTMLNGFVDQNCFSPRTLLMQAVAVSPDREEKLRTLFLCILTREPTRADLARFQQWLDEQPGGAPDPAGTVAPAAQLTDQLVRTATWVLLNSHEFLFEP